MSLSNVATVPGAVKVTMTGGGLSSVGEAVGAGVVGDPVGAAVVGDAVVGAIGDAVGAVGDVVGDTLGAVGEVVGDAVGQPHSARMARESSAPQKSCEPVVTPMPVTLGEPAAHTAPSDVEGTDIAEPQSVVSVPHGHVGGCSHSPLFEDEHVFALEEVHVAKALSMTLLHAVMSV